MKNTFIRGGALLLMTNLVVNVLNYFYSVVVARQLGPIGFGELNSISSYLTILGVPTMIVSTLLIQKIAQHDDKWHAAAIYEQAFFAYLKKTWWLVLALFLLVPFVSDATNLNWVSVFFLIPLAALAVVGGYYEATLQGLQLFGWVAIAQIVFVCIKFLGVIFLHWFPNDLELLLLFLSLGTVASVVVKRYITNRTCGGNLKKVVKKQSKQTNVLIHKILFSPAVLLTAASITSLTLFNNLDLIIVKKMADPTSAGIYGSWSLFAKVVFYLLGPIYTLFMVFFAKNKHDHQSIRILRLFLIVFLIAGTIAYAAYGWFGHLLVPIIFGYRFAQLENLLDKAAIFGICYAAIAFINAFFLTHRSKWSLMLLAGLPIFGLINVILADHIDQLVAANALFAFVMMSAYLIVFLLLGERWIKSSD